MATTDLAQVAAQIQTKWASTYMKELRESLLLGALVNKDYSGSILKEGDTVRVSQILAPAGQIRTVGVDANTFDTSLLTTTYVDVKADKRFVAAFEIAELAELQSQLESHQSDIREALRFAMEQAINSHLFTFVSPSTSGPDHLRNSITDMNAAELGTIRMLASQAKWERSKGWYGLLDPSYTQDLLNATTLTSKEYGADDAPVIGGQIVNKRFGFNLLEDNSMGVDKGLFFHPDFLHFVMQTEPRFKVSDLHPLGQFGYKISVDLIGGAKLGIAGNVKDIFSTAAASGSDAS